MGIAATDGEVDFFPPANPQHDSFSSQPDQKRGFVEPVKAPVNRLATILEKLNLPVPPILKMDIEGFEFGVLSDMLSTDIRPKQLLVEFHHTLYDITGKDTDEIVEKLKSAGYEIFYVSDSGLEYGFVWS